MDTDYCTHGFDELQKAEEFYLEQLEDALKDSTRLDGDILLMNVMTFFTRKDMEKIVEESVEKIKNSLPSNTPE